MAKSTAFKSVLIGTAAGAAAIPLFAAVCAFPALKSGAAHAVICALAAGGILTLLIAAATLAVGGGGWYIAPAACLAGTLAAFLISGRKKKAVHRIPTKK